jgi:hypothetical protein
VWANAIDGHPRATIGTMEVGSPWLGRSYEGWLTHAHFGREELSASLHGVDRFGAGAGSWHTLRAPDRKYPLTIRREGSTYRLDDGETALEGTVGTDGTLTGIVIQNEDRGADSAASSFRLRPIGTFTEISTDGTELSAEVVDDSGVFFQFQAEAGTTYRITTETAEFDSWIFLLSSDRVVAENDDEGEARREDDRRRQAPDSQIEWKCPTSGLHYINVKGFKDARTHDFMGATGPFSITVQEEGVPPDELVDELTRLRRALDAASAAVAAAQEQHRVRRKAPLSCFAVA